MPDSPSPPRRGGLGDYVKAAFLQHWNLLFVGGAGVAALLTPWPDAVLPLLGAAELAYLAAMAAHPKFRKAIDAQAHARAKGPAATTEGGESATAPLARMVGSLSPESRRRFERLRERCLEMRVIAEGVRGKSGADPAADEFRTPGLDRLLWVFLRLLRSEEALRRFLAATDLPALQAQLQQLRARVDGAAGDERLLRSLTDSVAVTEMRIDNYQKAEGNLRFVEAELDRIEAKIQALTEMSVNRQDAEFLSSQVDAAAESMLHTEGVIVELQELTGIMSATDEPPPILETDWKEIRHVAG